MQPLELDRSQNTFISLNVSRRKSFTNAPLNSNENLSASYSSSRRVNTGNNEIVGNGSVTSFKTWLDNEVNKTNRAGSKGFSTSLLKDMQRINEIEQERDSPVKRKFSDGNQGEQYITRNRNNVLHSPLKLKYIESLQKPDKQDNK